MHATPNSSVSNENSDDFKEKKIINKVSTYISTI